MTPPAFDGKWIWTDTSGRSSAPPDALRGPDARNKPYLAPLEGTFRDLAGALRKGTCNECHAPENSSG